jgi:hypothetical protein
VPSVFWVGAVHDSVTAPSESWFTAMLKAGSEAETLPSLTLTTMFEYVPTLAASGVPEILPVVVLNVAQEGLLAIEKVSASPLASVAVGWKLYRLFAFNEVLGVPLIFGAELPLPTAMPKAGSEAANLPSLTLITMLE